MAPPPHREPTPPPPMFAHVGRPMRGQNGPGERGFRLLIAVGLLLAIGSFFVQERLRRSWRVVEVTMMPEQAAAAEAKLDGR